MFQQFKIIKQRQLLMKIISFLKKVYHLVSSMKFAIFFLVLFTLGMIAGTLLESIYGTPFAIRAVYHSPWFYSIQLVILLTLIFSALNRLPYKNALLGFYIVHTSLVILIISTAITHYYGLDGRIELAPGVANDKVELTDDVLHLSDQKINFAYPLPLIPREKNLNWELSLPNSESKIKIEKYIPFAKEETLWKDQKGLWLTSWRIHREQFQGTFWLSNSSAYENYTTHASLGPLEMYYLPLPVFKEFQNYLKSTKKKNKTDIVFYDPTSKESTILTGSNWKKTSKGYDENRFHLGGRDLTLTQIANLSSDPTKSIYSLSEKLAPPSLEQNKVIAQYIEGFTAIAFDEKLQPIYKDLISIYFLSDLTLKPIVFITKDENDFIQMGYGKGSQFEFIKYTPGDLTLPWMGLSVSLVDEMKDVAPEVTYVQTLPEKGNDRNLQAIQFSYVDQNQNRQKGWITNSFQKQFKIGEAVYSSHIGTKIVDLPLSLKLDHFKMDQVPGMQQASSYESFVSVNNSPTLSHIFMNNPLKSNGYTFYQSSYFQDDSGNYHSVLSVNKDPGRAMKYIGSLLLVFGILIQYLVSQRKVKQDS